MKTKICKICEIEKSLSEFYTYKMNGYGKKVYMSYCKDCHHLKCKEYTNKYRKSEKYRKTNRANSKRWRQAHLEICRERSRKYQKNNRKKINAYVRRWSKTERGKEVLLKKRKRIRLKYPWYKTYDSMKARCANKKGWYHKKGIKSLLTPTNLKFLWFRDKAYLLKQPSIDRIDNDGNYTLSNCRYIEMNQNRPKNG